MHYAVPRILHTAARLERLYTDFAAVGAWQRSQAWPGRFGSRVPEGIPSERITHFPALAFSTALGRRMIHTESAYLQLCITTGKRFCNSVLARGFGAATAIYAYNSAALELLRAARERGLFCVLEQTGAPRSIERRLLAEERAAWPEWESTAARSRMGEAGTSAFSAREAAEWECADLIVCGSSFAAAALARAGVPSERCRVVPYGVDPSFAQHSPQLRKSGLNVLFCGAVGVQKGVPHLLEAAKRLSPHYFRFRLVGAAPLHPSAMRELASRCEVIGAVPRTAVADHYRWADVFVLPSICEGSATVCYEALAAGLPVITTPNAGSVVRNGIDGYIVPIRDAAAIARKLDLLASDPELLQQLSANARERAREFTVARYGERLLSTLSDAILHPYDHISTSA
jgi:glycosyltransferase involved in cell wall biosynthesis